jgi:single-strand DNA-binding protein
MYQSVSIIGHLGGEPEMRYTPNGQAVTNFSVATNRRYTSNGQQVDETTWFRISAWGRLAEICNQYLRKGRLVFIEGRLNPDNQTGGPRVWTGNDGQPRASFEVTAQTVKFLGGKGDEQSYSAPAQQGQPEEDPIPF